MAKDLIIIHSGEEQKCPNCLKMAKDMKASKMKELPKRCEDKYPDLRFRKANSFCDYIYIEIFCDSCNTNFIIENGIPTN